MEKYESIEVLGEGSYGIVMKCRHKKTGQAVAIKKFIENEDNHNVRKIALREIRMLKKLHHDNVVNMIEVFRGKRRFYLVFEYMDHTILDELEENPKGLGEKVTRQHMFQVIRGIDFCHKNNIVHRDVKPENILVSHQGVIKLCDFGFARLVSSCCETYTDYVATRWYRAPELLVGDTKYDTPVDVWAIGCLFAEIMSGDPIFPGETDIDQLYLITRLLGRLCVRHQQLISKNSHLKGTRKSVIEYAGDVNNLSRSLYKLFPSWHNQTLDIVSLCLSLDPSQRPTSIQLLQHTYFTHDSFLDTFLPELRKIIDQEFQVNPLLNKRYLQTFENNLEVKDFAELRQHQVPRWKMNYSKGKTEKQETLRHLDNNIAIGKQQSGEDDLGEGKSMKFHSLNKYSPLLGSLKPTHDQPTSLTCLPKYTNSLPFQPHSFTDQMLPTPPNVHSGLLHTTANNISVPHTLRSGNSERPWIQPKADMLGIAPSTQLVRKLEQRLTTVMETRPAWKNKGVTDDFSLPHFPGVPGTPRKMSKRKLNPVISNGTAETFVSPGQKSRSPLVIPSP